MYWIIQNDIKSNCRINTRFFPFDTHHCQIIFGPERAPNVVIKPLVSEVIISFYNQPNSDWKLVRSAQAAVPTEARVLDKQNSEFNYCLETLL